MSRLDVIKGLAKSTALELAKNNLQSQEPSLATLCLRLDQFRPLLGGDVPEDQAGSLIDTGLSMVAFNPNEDYTDEEEAVRLLHTLLDKLESMKPMLGL